MHRITLNRPRLELRLQVGKQAGLCFFSRRSASKLRNYHRRGVGAAYDDVGYELPRLRRQRVDEHETADTLPRELSCLADHNTAGARGHKDYVMSIAFSSDGTRLVSGSRDGTVRLWDTVPAAVRWSQRRAANRRYEIAQPIVDELFEELQEPAKVAEKLRSDRSLDEPLRRATLNLVLRRSAGAAAE